MQKEQFRYIDSRLRDGAIEAFIDGGHAKEAGIEDCDVLDFMKDNVTVCINYKGEIVDFEF